MIFGLLILRQLKRKWGVVLDLAINGRVVNVRECLQG